MLFMMLGGCANSAGSEGALSTSGEATYFGQITAIDDSSITVMVSTRQQMPQMDGSQSTDGNGDGQAGAPEAPREGKPPSGDTPFGDDNAPDGSTAMGPGNMELTGEEQTINISESTLITVQSGNTAESGTAADLEVGSIVTITMQDGTVTGITVMQMGILSGAGGPRQGNNSGSQDSGITDETGSQA
jgi:hypothetical protein